MGQRLVVSIQKGGEEIANIYYHWSGYTCAALNEAAEIIDAIQKSKDEDIRLALLKHLEKTGGGVCGEDIEYASKLFPNHKVKTEGVDRNNGLIAFSEEQRKVSQKWSEMDLSLDLDNETADIEGAFWWTDEEPEDKTNTEVIDEQNLCEVPFEDIYWWRDKVYDLDGIYMCEYYLEISQ